MQQTVSISELAPGMFVESISTQIEEVPFKILPGLVMSNKDIDQFRKYGIKELVVNLEKSRVDIFKIPRAQLAFNGKSNHIFDHQADYSLGSLLKLTNQKLAVVSKASNDPSDSIELLIFYDMVTKTNTEIKRIEVNRDDSLIDSLINPADFDEELGQFLKLVSL